MQNQETFSGIGVQGTQSLAGGAGVSPENLSFLCTRETQEEKQCSRCSGTKGRFKAMTKAEQKRESLLANLGDLNRPLRVRPVYVLGREWWAIDAEDTWPGMVMDLRRLGFESMAWEDEVLVREGLAYEQQAEGPASQGGLKPFPLIQPTIQIRKESRPDLSYLENYDDEEEVEEDEFEADDDQQYE